VQTKKVTFEINKSLPVTNAIIILNFSSWFKTCLENLRKINVLQKEIAMKRVSFEGTDDLGESEFTMFENMFQTEEKLQSVFHQLQKMTSTEKESVPLETVRSQMNLAEKALTDVCPPTRSLKHVPQEVKLPQIIKQSLDRATTTTKYIDHPMNTIQSDLQSAEHTPKPEYNIVRSSLTTKRPTLLCSQHTRVRSMLPVRDESIALREFVSFTTSKKYSLQPSKLPLPKIELKEQQLPQKQSKLPSTKRSRLPLPKRSQLSLPKIKVSKQQQTKFMPLDIGTMQSFSVNSGEDFTATVKLPHTVVGPLLPLPPVGGGPFPPLGGGPFPPLLPVGGRGVRTSTNLRRKHFTLQQVLIH
jgi:hypothetical protein